MYYIRATAGLMFPIDSEPFFWFWRPPPARCLHHHLAVGFAVQNIPCCMSTHPYLTYGSMGSWT